MTANLQALILQSGADYLRARDPVLWSASPEVALAYVRERFAKSKGLVEAVQFRRENGIAAAWLRELPFDSRILQLRAGKVELAFVDPPERAQARELFEEVTRLAVARRFEHLHLRLGAEDGVLIRAAEDAGFRWVSSNAHFIRGAGADALDLPPPTGIRCGISSDETSLRELAAQAFGTGTRFHLDPWLDPVAAIELHSRWAVNALKGDAADAVFCAVEEIGRLAGFISVSHTPHSRFGGPPTVEIGLIAVAGNARRRGVGRRLVGAALRWARENGAQLVVVGTESVNFTASRLYLACGFRLVGMSVSLSWGAHCLDQLSRAIR